MSRGPGRLGREIMAEIERAGGLASTDRLREKFPREVADKSFFRAVRSLDRVGAVEVVDEPGAVLGDRVLVLNFGWSDTDRELMRQSELILRMLQTVAGAHGAPVPEEARALRELARRP